MTTRILAIVAAVACSGQRSC